MVDRYTPMYAETATDRFCRMLHSQTGEFVLASDYDALAAERDALRAAARKVTQHHFDTCDESKFTGPCSCGVADLRTLLEKP